MSTSSLKEFANPVPVCQPNLELATLLDLFGSSGCDAIVVVSQEQHPLGVVNLRRVMPYMFSVTGLLKNSLSTAKVDFQKPLAQIHPPIIEPVTILSAQLSLNQFCAHLGQEGDQRKPEYRDGETEKWGDISHSPTTNNQQPTTNDQQWVLVDEDGKFLGLLNYSLLLKSLAPNFTATDAVNTANQRQPRGVNVLVQLLEQLPLPLSLQTSTGQVVAQNSSWRQQIGTSPDLDWVKYNSTVGLNVSELGANRLQQQCQLPDFSSASEVATALLSEATPLAGRVALMSTIKAKASDCSCRIDVPYQRRLLTPPVPTTNVQYPYEVLNTVESSIESGAKVPESQEGDISNKVNNSVYSGIDKSQSTCFSFVRTPLSPSVASLEDWVRSNPAEYLHFSENKAEDRGQKTERKEEISSSLSSTLWLVLAQDTTEQQQVTQELAAKNADLVQLNRLKDEFLACISHELKTPLTAVLGLSKLLKDQALGTLNERQARYAQLIYQSGRQLMTVVNDILDLTRIETGQLQLTIDAVKIQAICDRAYAQAQQRLVNQKSQEEGATQFAQFHLQIAPDLEVIVADELRLCQMLVHLLENALKFTDSNGEIGLTVSHWEGWIAFTVWDTGIGIPEEKQHLIFQKFQQLEEPLTRRFDGTGLGLVLTQRLANLHGGDISFISKPDEGSQFTLLLPPCPPQEKWEENAPVVEEQEARILNQKISTTEGATGKGIQGKSSTTQQIRSPKHQQPTTSLVLIVETVPRYLADLNEQLQGLGYHVVIARAGTEAIEKARRLQPCAIFLNPLLPQLSGWDVLTLLKSDQHTHHIPIFVTATQAEKRQAYHHKADGFLTLPVQEQALIKTLASLAKPQTPTSSSLTILYLTLVATHDTSPVSPALSSELTNFLNLQHSQIKYRILEADDLEQAEILTRVWHPDVLLLDSEGITDPLAYLQQLAQYESLTALPLVTLNYKTTEAANQVSNLCVYPCLAVDASSKVAAVLQVVQVAAGMSHKPNVLVMDIGEIGIQGMSQSPIPTSLTPQSSWRQALMQYLQTAGFRGLLANSWVEVYRQLQTQNFDLLLIRLTQIRDSSVLAKRLNSLAQLQKLPPVLVLDHRLGDESVTASGHSTLELESLLQGIATQVLRGYSQSMSQLLAQIKQVLAWK
ncbi:MAG: hybrid sensor histidine kinase/response regulator [Symploca sp. SIO2D2]|nr:hybrid sensor histidine kinase/response regulator [Symploca sp. SIO2D2]